ncbi:MAG: DNA polymerase III subunit gamma/tau [Anaerolineaceae bacterium]
MSQALYRKWRPRKWDKVVGQDHIVTTLRNAIASDRVGHAYLFSGPRGTGKTTTARLLAKAVNCLSPDLANRPCDACENCLAVNEGRFLDLIEIDAASNTSVEDVRDLRDKINFSPSAGRFKVYIIDEVHMLSTAAFNALLKTLEEPPAHAIFILATTEVHKIPATVLSRCQRHEFRRIPVSEIVKTLKELAEAEKIEYDEEALLLIARQATGAMRDAISLLDQLASTGSRITLDLAQQVLGTATNLLVTSLISAIQKGNTSAGLETIHQALDGGSDPRQFARQTVEYLRSLLLIKMGNEKQVDATADTKGQMKAAASAASEGDLIRWINLFNAAINDLRTSWQPGLALELAFAQAIQPAAADVIEKPASAKNVVSTPAPSSEVNRMETLRKVPAAEPAQKKQAAPAASEAPAEKKAGEGPRQSGSAQMILSNWGAILSEVKKQSRSQIGALLNSQKLIQVRENVLTIGFASELLKSKMETQENLEVTRKAIKEVTGVDMEIRCVVATNKAGGDPANLDIDNDGIVGAALNLGGKLVHRE